MTAATARRLAALADAAFAGVPAHRYEPPDFGGGGGGGEGGGGLWGGAWDPGFQPFPAGFQGLFAAFQQDDGDGRGGRGERGERGDSDSQNVHDHGVASGIRAAVAEIRAALAAGPGEPLEPEEVAAEQQAVLCHAFKRMDGGGMASAAVMDALTLMDSLGDTPYDAFGGVSERRMLACVWRHIGTLADPELAADMRDQLVLELAAAVERGATVCSAGKFARMVAVYDARDVLAAVPKPMWAVREELGRLAARERDRAGGDEEEEEGPSAGAWVSGAGGGDSKGGEESRDSRDSRDSRARVAFLAAARAEYIHKIGMSAAVMEPIIAEYADAL
jgi:hypothetical protein